MSDTCLAASPDPTIEALDRLRGHAGFVQAMLRLPECEADMLTVLRLLARIHESEEAHAAELARKTGAKIGESLEAPAEPADVRYSLAKNRLAPVVEAWLASSGISHAAEVRGEVGYFVFAVGASRVGVVENFLSDVKFDERYPADIERRLVGADRRITGEEARRLRYARASAAAE